MPVCKENPASASCMIIREIEDPMRERERQRRQKCKRIATISRLSGRLNLHAKYATGERLSAQQLTAQTLLNKQTNKKKGKVFCFQRCCPPSKKDDNTKKMLRYCQRVEHRNETI